MAAYTVEDRGKLLLSIPSEVKAELKALAEERGITLTAMVNIVIMYGLDVHRLLDSQRNTAVSLVTAGK